MQIRTNPIFFLEYGKRAKTKTNRNHKRTYFHVKRYHSPTTMKMPNAEPFLKVKPFSLIEKV
jgi:hypothetical protein